MDIVAVASTHHSLDVLVNGSAVALELLLLEEDVLVEIVYALTKSSVARQHLEREVSG